MKRLFLKAARATLYTKSFGVLAGLALFSGSVPATQQVGYSSVSNRTQIVNNIYTTQWGPPPLFNFLLQTSNGLWGYDFIHATNTFAVASADGTPSQSGWHDHPVPIGLVQVIQGAVWEQEASTPTCLNYYPTGSMFIESAGKIHNVFNFDKKTAGVTMATWFIERYLASTRRDQPDPTTGNPTVASTPPTAICPGSAIPPQ